MPTAYRTEAYLLTGSIDIDLVHGGIEVEYIRRAPVGAFDETDLGFPERKLSRTHRAGAVYRDCNLSNTFLSTTGKIQTLMSNLRFEPLRL